MSATGDGCLQLADSLLQSHYSRANEAEADFCGYHIAAAAGFNPDGLFHRCRLDIRFHMCSPASLGNKRPKSRDCVATNTFSALLASKFPTLVSLLPRFSLVARREAAELARIATLPAPLYLLMMLWRSHVLISDRRASLRKLAQAREAAERAAREAAHQKEQERRRRQRRHHKLAGRVLAGAGWLRAQWRT